MTTVNARIHVDAPRGGIAQQRDEDGAYFADWSLAGGPGCPWVFPAPAWRAIVVRPSTTSEVAVISRLGGRQLAHHRYDSSGRRDWLVPAWRWRELHAALPALAAIRERASRERAIREGPAYEVFRVTLGGRPALAAYTNPDRAWAAQARALGARFRRIFDRTGWVIAADHPGADDFRRLVEGKRPQA